MSIGLNTFLTGLLITGGLLLLGMLCLRQVDGKSLVALSSVLHISVRVFFFYFMSRFGEVRFILLMVSHGFISGGLFFTIGGLYYTRLTRLIQVHGGLMRGCLSVGFLVMLLFLTNGGLAPFLGFFREVYGLASL